MLELWWIRVEFKLRRALLFQALSGSADLMDFC